MESADARRGESGFRFESLLRRLQGVTTGVGLTGGLSTDFLLIRRSESGPGSGLGLGGGLPAVVRPSVFSSNMDGLIILSVCLLLLTRRTMSLVEDEGGEEILGVLGSDGLLLREDTLAGGRRYWRSFSSGP